MIFTSETGVLTEPLSGRAWDPTMIRRQWTSRAAHYADSGLRRGDLAFLFNGNTLEFFADLLAAWALGACVAPVDARLTAFQIDTLARAGRPRLALWPSSPPADVAVALATLGVAVLESPGAADVEPVQGPRASELDGPELDHDALVLFTSGTTGSPKGVVHTHRSLLARWTALRAHVGLADLGRSLCLLPTHFGHGLICNALYPWLGGQRLAVLPPFRSEVILQLGALVDEHEITFVSSVPALWRLALRTARPPRKGTLRRVFCGSAPLSAAMWRGIGEWAGGAAVSNVYGLTETASWVAGAAAGTVPEDGLVGQAWGAALAVRDAAGPQCTPPGPTAPPGPSVPRGAVGSVWVRTPGLMRGYLGRDDLTAAAVQDGWLATGDLGCLDASGRLHLRGREREEINRGGMKVYPGEVEAIVDQFDRALDSCAFGYDDGRGQEEVAVAVVLTSADPETLRRLHAWTRARLAAHQMPRRWHVVDEIPRTARGKVSRSQVASRCAGIRPVELRDLAADQRGGPGEG
jgi:acyl-CoA synthetase (AMP-forming)/AMP-acid ligase II